MKKKYGAIKLRRPDNLSRAYTLAQEARNRGLIAFRNGFLKTFTLFTKRSLRI